MRDDVKYFLILFVWHNTKTNTFCLYVGPSGFSCTYVKRRAKPKIRLHWCVIKSFGILFPKNHLIMDLSYVFFFLSPEFILKNPNGSITDWHILYTFLLSYILAYIHTHVHNMMHIGNKWKRKRRGFLPSENCLPDFQPQDTSVQIKKKNPRVLCTFLVFRRRCPPVPERLLSLKSATNEITKQV